ncbi:branched-chain amino acid ABC transporter substrate-binding protein [Methylobrevis pamukkalensis]|uniref:Leucine-specific-binding protein n=1 Tax=Methylobrevis pamukkalensis TaxID=1439726 RepID=A0A1E3H4G3_9HYPH|nr:branched-chain amino acid ABC transporter substrate-binding protein [Methylobrevis pamukkalensis]ODN71237.1 Leucine-specific-binding protein precursor [Methylobrevis pamukkalensis]
MKRSLLSLVGLAALVSTSLTPVMAEEVTIGAEAPLSGPQALFGVTWHNGIKMYFDEVNAKGGVNGKTFVLEQLDDKADPREGTLVAQKLCDDDNVKAAIGPFNSGVAQASLSIYGECGMPQLVFGSNPALTTQGFTHLFRPVANDFAQGGLPAKYAFETLKATKAAVIHDKQVFGQGVATIFTRDFEGFGGTVVSSSAVNPTDVDFTALITQLKSQSPEVIYLGAVMPQLALFAKQMKEQGLEAKLIVPDGGYTPDLAAQAGKDAAQGVVVSFQVPPMDASEPLKAFAAAYKAKFGEDVGPYSVYGYVIGQIAVEAVAKAASTEREDIIEALRTIKIDTAVGPIEFTETGDLKVAPVFLYAVDGDGFKLVASSE